MLGKLICASVLVTASVPVLGQTASRNDKATPLLYRCSVTPAPNSMAINTKGAGATTGRSTAGATVVWDRIDLEFNMTGPLRGQTIPMISGHAINEKGTGVNSKRLSGSPGSLASVSCAGAVPTNTDDAMKTSEATMNIRTAKTRRSVDMSCNVSGTAERPEFTIGILADKMVSNSAGFSGSTFGEKRRKPRKGESLTDWMASVHNTRVSIVRYEWDRDFDGPRVACSSETPAMQMQYDLAQMKKV